ncbi:hypothetical protein P3T73_15175 [Kiritimatiellota bacterium B12222]|nr:hypothetical protein P3T73_15175 [Kiritimatiellota bacterium B12222]
MKTLSPVDLNAYLERASQEDPHRKVRWENDRVGCFSANMAHKASLEYDEMTSEWERMSQSSDAHSDDPFTTFRHSSGEAPDKK